MSAREMDKGQYLYGEQQLYPVPSLKLPAVGVAAEYVQIVPAEQRGLTADVELMKRLADVEFELKRLSESLKLKVVSVPIMSLNASGWRLKSPPLIVTVEKRDDEEFIACLYDIKLYGYGDSIPEALDELRYAIVSQFEFLSEKRKEIELGELPENQFRFLEQILEEERA